MVTVRQKDYETVVIVRPDVEEGAKKEIQETIEGVVEDADGEMLELNDWGTRDLAYEIDGEAEGVSFTRGDYQCYSYRAPSGVVAEVERQLRLSDTIIKFMTVKQQEGITRKEAS